MDRTSYDILKLLELPNAIIMYYQDVETPELSKVRKNRKLMEYCWTLKPAILAGEVA